MTTPCSGCISLTDIATELGVSPTCLSLGAASVRGLAGVASGCIDMSDLYCKSAAVPCPTPVINQAVDGPAVPCPTPSVGSASPLVGTVGTAYSGTLTITNATGGSITNLPVGLSQSGAASGSNWVITITGTPTAAASTALLVNATNACGGGLTTSSVTAQSGGTLVITAPSTACPTPVINQATP